MDKNASSRNGQSGYEYAKEALSWYGWASPVGLGIGLALFFSSLGFFLWMLRLANLIK